jgi:hypothetical protein
MIETSLDEKTIAIALKHFAEAFAAIAVAGLQSVAAEIKPAAFDAKDAAKDAAKDLGIGRTKLHEMRVAGLIAPVDVEGCPRYLRKHLDKYLSDLESRRPLKRRAG